MDNIKKIACYQKVDDVKKHWEATDNFPVAYLAYINSDTKELKDLTSKEMEIKNISLAVKLEYLNEDDYKYSDDNIIDAIMKEYDTFDEFYCGEKDDKFNKIKRNLAANEIARYTRRGVGKEIIDGFMIYKHDNDLKPINVDGPLMVSESIINGVKKYAIFKHPYFKLYGYKLIDKDQPK